VGKGRLKGKPHLPPPTPYSPLPIPSPELPRTLGLRDATMVGLGAIIGSGIFVGLGPATEAAGAAVLLSLLLAAVPAALNALSSAALGATFPRAGGTYQFGRQTLGNTVGFVAGWAFLIAKCASGAFMATGFGLYLFGPGVATTIAALCLVAAVTLIDLGGPRLSAIVNLSLILLKVGILLFFVGLAGYFGRMEIPTSAATFAPRGWNGVWQGAALLFSVYAGYARIATLAEEVIEPRRTLPRAVFLALGGSLLLYLLVAAGTLRLAGSAAVAASSATLSDALKTSGVAWAAPVMTVGAVIASASAFLVLLSGISRVVFAMAREGDLPRRLSYVSPKGVPITAVAVSGMVVAAFCFMSDIKTLLAINAGAILFYYTLTNLSALRLTPEQRRYPPLFCILGALFCIYLIAGLPWRFLIADGALILLGLAGYVAKERAQHSPRRP
jgi:basic amino acid/polyamine antiporter, APA family